MFAKKIFFILVTLFGLANSYSVFAQSQDGCKTEKTENSNLEQIGKIVEEVKLKAQNKEIEDQMLLKLKKLGHHIFPIKNLDMIVKKGSPIDYHDLTSHKCSALLSGTFYAGKYIPVGPYVVDGKLSTPESKTITRGYVAVLSDGSVQVSSMNETKYNYRDANDRSNAHALLEEHLQKIENEKGKKIEQLLGGGALLIRTNSKGQGQAVSANELESSQFFDQGIGDLTGAQMRKTNHVVVFIQNGKPYAMLSASVSGKTLQKDLLAVHAQSAVKFDGGSGCVTYVAGVARNLCPAKGSNPSGLCVK